MDPHTITTSSHDFARMLIDLQLHAAMKPRQLERDGLPVRRARSTPISRARSPGKALAEMAEREGFEPSEQVFPTRRFSKPVPSAYSATSPCFVTAPCTPLACTANDISSRLFGCQSLAEEEGFEPPELSLGGFQDRCLRPLGHSSGVPGGKTRGIIDGSQFL
jgi:hypothetical protein